MALKPNRKIIHIDMDAFYASVEQRDHPELRNRPVIVGGRPGHRGVVASCSYEARKFGIRSAMSSTQAQRLCPHAAFVSPNFSRYKKVSDQIHEIFETVTDLIEPLSLDEAYLDVTENKLGEPIAKKVAIYIKERIKKELNLIASAGVGPNKFIAKIASDLQKPDGLVVIPPSSVEAFVEKLPIEKLWGVGPATAKRLHEFAIFTAGDLKKCKLHELESAVGKYGSFLQGLAYGIDEREVEPNREAKSSGTETTLDRDILDVSILRDYLEDQADELERDLKRNSRTARTITLKVKYGDFKSVTRSRTLAKPTSQAKVIARTAKELLVNSTDVGVKPIRLIGISVSGFPSREEPEQLWLDFEIPNP